LLGVLSSLSNYIFFQFGKALNLESIEEAHVIKDLLAYQDMDEFVNI